MTYQIWAFTQAGAKAAYLENAFNISRSGKMNQTPTLSLSLPADDAKAAFLTSAYEVKVWNTIKDRWEGLFTLDDATEKWDASGSIIEANYSGAMVQLAEEENISYDTTAVPKTPTQIITALLALQEHVPAITIGTIQPTTSFAFAIENANLLAAILKCVDYLGGWIEVDADRHLNWYTDPTGNPVREIRYQKNMKGVTRKRDFTTIRNKIYAYGYGETEAQVTLIDAGETYEYIQDSTSQTAYGIKSKRITDKRIIHPSTLLRWAQKYLADNKDPTYYYTVDAVNLAEHPDFDFDFEEMEIGQIIRVVNSDLNNLNVNVKIVSITHTDLKKPENITLELANATKDLSDSFSDVKSYQNLAQNTSVQIGAGQVTVQGTFTVDGWRSAGVTTIDGGKITAASISVNKLDFTVVGSTNVVASINASTEGIKIAASKITISGDCTFGTGYDPSTKIKSYYQTTEPSTGMVTGDLWIDTDDNNKVYRYSGTAWVVALDKVSTGSAAADVNANVTTISGGKITANTIDCDRLTSSTINAKTITLGTTGGDAIIKSGNFTAGSAGWQIKADGSAEFSNVTVRGNIGTCTIGSGITITVIGAIQSQYYSHDSDGWKIDGGGDAEFHTITAGTISSYGDINAGSGHVKGKSLMIQAASPSGYESALYSPNGDDLYWADSSGHAHIIFDHP